MRVLIFSSKFRALGTSSFLYNLHTNLFCLVSDGIKVQIWYQDVDFGIKVSMIFIAHGE